MHANLSPNSAVWMRSDISRNCSTPTQPHALAVVYYPEANRNAIPTSVATPVVDDYCGNVLFSKAFVRVRLTRARIILI